MRTGASRDRRGALIGFVHISDPLTGVDTSGSAAWAEWRPLDDTVARSGWWNPKLVFPTTWWMPA